MANPNRSRNSTAQEQRPHHQGGVVGAIHRVARLRSEGLSWAKVGRELNDQGKCSTRFYQRFRRLRGRLGDVLMIRWLLFGPHQLILITVSVFLIWEASHVVKEL